MPVSAPTCATGPGSGAGSTGVTGQALGAIAPLAPVGSPVSCAFRKQEMVAHQSRPGSARVRQPNGSPRAGSKFAIFIADSLWLLDLSNCIVTLRINSRGHGF